MRRIALTLGYVGSGFSGWQRQPGRDTVQSRVEDALFAITGERVNVVASGRTDAGVHALGQVAHFDTQKDYPARNFMTGANRFLPPEIRVTDAREVPADFHARFSAHEKTYRYVIYESKVDRAEFYGRAARVLGPLDLSAMNEAAAVLVGTHDFASFCAADADTTTSVRTLFSLSAERKDGLVLVTATADGFLYKMVRLMTAVLVRAGEGRMTADEVRAALEARSTEAVRWCIPPDGLYLVEVKYPDFPIPCMHFEAQKG